MKSSKNKVSGFGEVNTPDSIDVTIVRNAVSKADTVLLSFNTGKKTVSYAMDPHSFLSLYSGLKDMDEELRKIGYA